jgi:3-oxoacyl-[acyl-carrier protein] reductase
MFDLANKIALVTGASRGIGRATTQSLAKAGARVLIHYGHGRAEADSLVAEIRAAGGYADALQADLATPEGVTSLSTQVRNAVGERLDILISNAGIAKPATIMDHTVEDFDKLFAINVRSGFFLTQQLLPLLGQGSSIIFVSSLAGHAVPSSPGRPNAPVLSAYAATKGALEALVKHWASELGPRGIRVNAVAPGVIDTDMSSFTKSETGRNFALEMQALKRIGQPSDIADVIVFLATEAARWITGACIPVDGGSRL